jgi:hypothetical protein
MDATTCLLEEEARGYLLLLVSLLLWWNILGKEGFILISLELGKEFMLLYCFFLVVRLILLNSWRSIRAYTLHQDL